MSGRSLALSSFAQPSSASRARGPSRALHLWSRWYFLRCQRGSLNAEGVNLLMLGTGFQKVGTQC